MPPIRFECTVVGCNLAEAGGKYKMPPLPSGEAFQLLLRPIPHILEENGKMMMAMPKAHPKIRVQFEVNREMYKQTGRWSELKMKKSSLTWHGKCLQRGIPDSRNNVTADLREFHKCRHGLVVVNGVITFK